MELAKEMRALLGQRAESGLSLLAFSKREKLSYAKLLYWDRKFRGLEVKRRKSAPKVDLMPVRVVPEAVSAEEPRPVLGVWLGNGVSLEIPTNSARRTVPLRPICRVQAGRRPRLPRPTCLYELRCCPAKAWQIGDLDLVAASIVHPENRGSSGPLHPLQGSPSHYTGSFRELEPMQSSGECINYQ